MHVHLPKPLHGWREFLGEVGIIVIGVLIALSAEQVIENLHWRHEVEAGREALESEIENIASLSLERESMSACLGHRFQDIATIIDQAAASGRLPAVGPIGNPSRRPWHVQSWDSLIAAQTATHFPKEEMLALGGLETLLRSIDESNVQEFNDWTTLWTIVGPGRRLASGEEFQLRQALTRAAYNAKLMRVMTRQTLELIKERHLLPNDKLAEIERQGVIDGNIMREKGPVCRPIGAAPTQYGASPIQLDLTAPMPSS